MPNKAAKKDLRRQYSPAYKIGKRDDGILRQKQRFVLLRERLGQPDIEKVRQALDERERVEPEANLDSAAVEKLRLQ